MKQYTYDQFSDKTGLLPHIVAETVLAHKGVDATAAAWFVEHVERRTVHVYNHNRDFRKRMNGAQSRDYLYMFVQHWLDGYIKSPEAYVHRYPHDLFSVADLTNQ